MTPKINESSIETGDAFTKGQLLLDLVYNPIETKLMCLAKARGVKTISELEMLIHQGAKSFELWTNSKMPIEKVREVLLRVSLRMLRLGFAGNSDEYRPLGHENRQRRWETQSKSITSQKDSLGTKVRTTQ